MIHLIRLTNIPDRFILSPLSKMVAIKKGLGDRPLLEEKAEFLRALFSSIPDEYDQFLRVLTCRQDARWRRKAIRKSEINPPAQILDLATGTGIFAFDWIDALGPSVKVVALDLTAAMLEQANQVRERRRRNDRLSLICGVTESLPFPDERFDAVSIGLALRNLSSLERSFSEMARVVRPGGKIISIDFTRPANPLVSRIYYPYLCKGLPAIGRAISPEWEDTFEYLWRSIMNFKSVGEVISTLDRIGLKEIDSHSLTCGIATLIVGTRP